MPVEPDPISTPAWYAVVNEDDDQPTRAPGTYAVVVVNEDEDDS